MDHFEYRNGRLWCEGVPAEDLAARFGTPLYVYSRATLEGHYDRLAAAFADLRPLICYSIKSCSNVHVCRVLVERGAGLDAVSGGEVERARRAGCPMERVVYAGVGKTDAEIEDALCGMGSASLPAHGQAARARLAHATRIGLFNIESEPEFENIARLARERGVRCRGALRINPDVDPKTHAYTSTGRKESKFGVGIARAVRFFERYGRDEWLTLDALHLHIGSPVYETGPYVEAIRKTLGLIDDLAGRGFTVRTLDLGGGFGADYETERSPRAADYAAAIVPLLRERVAGGLSIILEPGRQISANAGVLLTKVLYVKDGGGGKRFIIGDAGMHTLIRPALYGSFHFIWPASPAGGASGGVPARRTGVPDLPGLSPCDVVGPICESADFLAKDRMLPPVSRGDVLAVFAAGAYGMSMASTYNTQPLPAEVMVEGDAARVIRRRQALDELLAPEA
ncbi:MAG: diaminopimelate decarboxylase [Phycisphaerales bacterium]|nr:diaminopimelate decarboxylase [Phycisphaerales bacterium]